MYEWVEAVEQYKQTSDWEDLKNKAEDEGKDLEEAWEENVETFADWVYCDIEPLVEGWIQRHGCQFTEVLTECLDEQEASGENEDEDEDEDAEADADADEASESWPPIERMDGC
tara:strand:- start:6667 stop:7008 length:342 start_codon:yes stop_codon:yes gene_type:complete